MNHNIKKMSFEESMAELKIVSSKLQNMDVDLDQLVKQYEYGLKLKQHAYHLLNSAQLKIDKIQSENNASQDDIKAYKEDFLMICDKFFDYSVQSIENNKEIEYSALVSKLKTKFNEIREYIQKEE